RERSPNEQELRMLSLVAASLPAGCPPDAKRTEYHLALAEAHRILGENEAAATNYRAALTHNPNLPQAHLGLAGLRMPGDNYLVWLDRLYRALSPDTVIEIGVYHGESLALLRPPTIAIGIDPNPAVVLPLKTETHIFAETSDDFFARRRPEGLLAGRPLSVG